jgi:serine/threonine protein kinase
MELVVGEPLSALLAREGRLGLGRSLEIIGQAAVAGWAAHRVGLVHRDIEPANLLVCPDGMVKVTDFGVAQALGQGQGDQRELLVGMAGYLSPEWASGQAATAVSDLNALGWWPMSVWPAGAPSPVSIQSRSRWPICCRRRPTARGRFWGWCGRWWPGDGQTADPPTN